MLFLNCYLKKCLEVSVVIMLAVMSGLVFLNVILRYGFNTSFSMTEELSRYLFVWITFLGAILVFIEQSHIRITVFIDRLPIKIKYWVNIFTNSLMFYCCYLILLGAYQQMQLNLHNYSPISSIPTGINFLAVVLMSGFISILLLLNIVNTLLVLWRNTFSNSIGGRR